jgi:AcrR family transcriptional regulator
MKTKDLIKKNATSLFNLYGVSSVTLRDVAKQIKKSYGNITYHFPNKEKLITDLYTDMILELQIISQKIKTAQNMFFQVLDAPNDSFDLSLKYLFLFKDYVEITRAYPKLAEMANQSNTLRKRSFKKMIETLLNEQILRADLTENDYEYLLELSGVMRTFFFVRLDLSKLVNNNLKEEYVIYTNQLLYPYLSAKGQVIYKQYFTEHKII